MGWPAALATGSGSRRDGCNPLRANQHHTGGRTPGLKARNANPLGLARDRLLLRLRQRGNPGSQAARTRATGSFQLAAALAQLALVLGSWLLRRGYPSGRIESRDPVPAEDDNTKPDGWCVLLSIWMAVWGMDSKTYPLG
jgi:hypothetical protein